MDSPPSNTPPGETGEGARRDPADPDETSAASPPSLVVGIGGSAGGLDPCRRLLGALPTDRDLAVVVVMHLDPDHVSHLAEILGKATTMPVRQIAGGERLAPSQVYVIAPGTRVRLEGGVLVVDPRTEPHFQSRPIDAFFASMAEDRGSRCAAVVLSGIGDDGAHGLGEVRAAGGLCLAQAPESAEYDTMPRSAVGTGVLDAAASPEDLAPLIVAWIDSPEERPVLPRPDGELPALSGMEGILALIGRRYRIDFREYKTGTLGRRTARRMSLRRITDYDDYIRVLLDDPAELEALYGDLLIGVTGFFRDPESWAHLEATAVPEIVSRHRGESPIRIWSAGCASGEEAYGLAMVFLEQIEQAGSRASLQVFASDVSHGALAVARRGVYPSSIEAEVGPDRLRRFFSRVGEDWHVKPSLRQSVTFAAHNVLLDPPFARLDLVACRNLLIYLQPEAQARVLEALHFSLLPGGILWLGSAETVGRRADLYEAVSNKHRTYRAIATTPDGRQAIPKWSPEWTTLEATLTRVTQRPKEPRRARQVEQFMLQNHVTPSVIVNRNLEMVYFFGSTDAYLRQPAGEARMDLLSWLRPGLYAKVRAGLMEAVEEKREVKITGMRLKREAETARIEAVVQPVPDVAGEGLFLVSFREAPKAAVVLPADETEPESALVRQLEQELQETRHELQATVEQLETANEEYRASHEELLSLNEEIQSSNEELETSKEELQSLNEELTTMNRQLEERNADLRTLGEDLNNLLVSTGMPTLFLDRQFRIRRFTPASSEVMRITDSDLGRPIDDLKSHVQDADLLGDSRKVLESLLPAEAEVTATDGRWLVRRILPYRTEEDRIEGVVVTYQDVTAQKRATEASDEARRFAEAVIHHSRMPLLVLDRDLKVVSVNPDFLESFKVHEAETVGRRLDALGNGQWNIPQLLEVLGRVLSEKGEVRGYDVAHVFESIGARTMRLNAGVMARAGGDFLIVSIEDVTDLRRAEAAARERADALIQDHRRKDEFLAMLGHELRNPLAALAHGLEILKVTGAAGPDAERIQASMTRQLRRLTAMLDQLLDVGRVISGKLVLAREAVDVAEAVEAAVEAVRPAIEAAGQDLSLDVPQAGAVLVLGDGMRLAQVVENLLANANRYTPKEGRIAVRVAATDETITLTVEDTGEGMTPEVIGHAFEIFTQAPREPDRPQGGLGLGLPLVRTLVELHGGDIRGESEGPGRGSTFVVTLPRLKAGGIAKSRQAAEGTAAGRRVLIVEDEVDAATFLAEFLIRRGQEVHLVHDGLAALDAAEEVAPDVVILDLGIPKLDGYEVARRLREARGDTLRIAAMTGYPKDAAREAAAGIDAHFVKPADLRALLAFIAGPEQD